jgi:ABC-type polysaccharide/polyol phosphate transport system ATPase subunit
VSAAVRVREVVMEFRLVHERNLTLKEAVVRRLKGKRRDRVERFRALDGVSFEVQPGEALGIIGPNGSGKTTMLRLLAGVLSPTSGTIDIDGRVTTLIELGAGFNPELSGEENVYLAGALYGFGRDRMRRKFDDIVRFADLERFIHVPLKNYSAGMSARLGFSVATDVDPDVLVVDEVLAVGDEAFQTRCIQRMNAFREARKTIVLVSHDLDVVQRFCSRVLRLEHGRIVQEGSAAEVVAAYRGSD